MRKLFVDMDGTLAEWKKASSLEQLYSKGYFLKLKPHKNLIEALKRIIKEGAEVYVLSAYFADSKYALLEKNKWLNKYFSIAKEKRIFVPCGVSKNIYADENSILLDDYNKNLKEWRGIPVKALNGINDINQSFTGERINVLDNPDKIYEKLKVLL